jgi:hypothetical protein
MDISSTHEKDPAVAWDISASAKAASGEKIARAQIIVNGSSQSDQSFDPPIAAWQQQLEQQGQYPGNNTVRVIITDDKGQDSESDDSWN